MSSLDEARRRIEERRQQQAQVRSGDDLWLADGDLAIAHFICTGADGDPYFDTYVVHEYPAKGEGKWPILKYCPVESAHDGNYNCEGCRDGIKTKDRMIMWFWVYDILHAQLKPGSTLPSVNFNGRPYFQRTMNRPMVWDESAWKQSPLDDILMLGNQLGGNLQASRMIVSRTGKEISTRYKVYLDPNTPPFPPELMEQAKLVIRPVVDILRERLVDVPTVQNPAMTPSNGQPIPAYTPATTIPAYVPGVSTSAGGPNASGAVNTTPGPAIPPKPGKGKPPKNMF